MYLNFQVDKKAYAGEKISGKLILDNSKKPLRHVRCSGISVYFRGKEYSLVGYDMTIRNVDDGSLMKERHYKRDTQEFYRLDLVVPPDLVESIIDGGRIHPGKYEIPFSFVLPARLPGSLRVFSGDYKAHKESDRAEISYCLRAKLEESGHLFAYQTRKTITVQAAPQRLERVPHFCGADENGRNAISVGSSFTHVAPGQKPVISVQIDKADKLLIGGEIKSVKLSLLQTTTWKADTFRKSSDTCIFGKKYSTKFKSPEIKELNEKSVTHIEFPIPHTTSMWNSHAGNLLTVEHEIEVRLIIKHGTYATEAVFSVPVTMAPTGSENLLVGKELKIIRQNQQQQQLKDSSMRSKSSRSRKSRARSTKDLTLNSGPLITRGELAVVSCVLFVCCLFTSLTFWCLSRFEPTRSLFIQGMNLANKAVCMVAAPHLGSFCNFTSSSLSQSALTNLTSTMNETLELVPETS